MGLLRNIGILAHIDAGKTTVTERFLVLGGVISRPGAVEDGSTVTDWMDEEQRRGITIGAAAVTCAWKGVDVTIIDTPGHVDFTWEVERCLNVLDGAVLVLSAPDGVQVQTQTVWHQAANHGLPVIGLVNKLDRPGFDHEALLVQIEELLGIRPLPLHVPVAHGAGVVSLIDVLEGRLLTWRDATKLVGTRAPEVDGLDEEQEVLRDVALEAIGDGVASYDDALAETLVAGGEATVAQWRRAISRAVVERACLPLFYGAARAGIGVEALLDGVVDLLPPPAAPPRPRLFSSEGGGDPVAWPDLTGDTIAYVFKTEARRGGKRVAHARVFGGSLTPGMDLRRLRGGEPWTCGPIVRLLGGWEDPVDELDADQVGGLLAVDGALLPETGETLVTGELAVSLEPSGSPSPVLAVSVEAEEEADHDPLRRALQQLTLDDRSLSLTTDRDTGQLLLSGMGELQLEVAVERLRREHRIPCRSGVVSPRHRETILHPVEAQATWSLGSVPDGEVELVIHLVPAGLERDGMVTFRADAPGNEAWREALVSGLEQAALQETGLYAVDVVVVALSHRGRGLTPRCFWQAATTAARDGASRAVRVPLEPWVQWTVAVPADHMGSVLGDLASRRAKILGTQTRGPMQVLEGEAPLGEFIAYATDLRSLTGGQGTVNMRPLGFRPRGAA